MPNFPATQHEIYETEFRKRFRDKSILSLVTNREWEGRFRKTGQTIHVPVLPLIHPTVTKPGEKIKYQEPKGAEETFTINRERYFAFKLEDEDKIFSKMDLESPLIAEGTRQMSEDVEGEFFADVPSKVHFCIYAKLSQYHAFADRCQLHISGKRNCKWFSAVNSTAYHCP